MRQVVENRLGVAGSLQPIGARRETVQMATEGGCNYTWSEYAAWLEAAGFREIQRVPVPSTGGLGILVGRKP